MDQMLMKLPSPYDKYYYTMGQIDKRVVVYGKTKKPLSEGYKHGYTLHIDNKTVRVTQSDLKDMLRGNNKTLAHASRKTPREVFLEQVDQAYDTSGPYLPTPLMPGYWVNKHGVIKTSTGKRMKPVFLQPRRDGTLFVEYPLRYDEILPSGQRFTTPTINLWDQHVAEVTFSNWYTKLLGFNAEYRGEDLEELERATHAYLGTLHKSQKKAMKMMWEDMFGPLFTNMEDGKRHKERLVTKTRKEEE